MTLYHERCEQTFSRIEDGGLDAIFTDPPFNNSELAGSEHLIGGFEDRRGFRRYMGEWDKEFSPLVLVVEGARTIKPGGWFIAKTGDRTLGLYRDLLSGDHSTTGTYLAWMYMLGLLDIYTYRDALDTLDHLSTIPKFEYKATVTWHRTNPPTRIRKTTYASSCEWFVVAKRLDENGKSVPAVAWNFLSQRSMHNHFSTPLCGGRERLYWHVQDPQYDGEAIVGGEIVPCIDQDSCEICQSMAGIHKDERPGWAQRRHHPTQTPLRVWAWFYERHTKPGMRVFDPYAGTGSGGVEAVRYGLDWFGSEADWEFATVGQKWLAGKWKMPERKTHHQLETF